MTIRHIKIFLAICEAGCNTTKAAEALHMSQPAVSLALREMEQYYGVALFDRMGRRLRITDAGTRFRDYALHIARLFDDMEKGMKDWDAFGLIRVGASVTIGAQFLPSYVKAFYDRYPGTEVHALVSTSEHLEEEIMANTLDLALIEGVPHSPDLVSESYMEDELAVICAPDLFPSGIQLTLEQFKAQKFLLREQGSGTREVFERTAASAGFHVEPIWEAMSTTALVNAVIRGLGVAVLPHRMVMGPIERGLVNTVTVEGLTFRREFRMIWHREKYLTAAARAFLDLCRNYEMDYPLPKYNDLF